MARGTPFLENINSGEFSPQMEARVSFGRYPNAAKMLRNCVLHSQGGFSRRPGTRYVAEVKDSSKDTSIFPFVYSEDQSYLIEHGDEYMRFFRRQGRLDVADTDAAITNGTFTSNINDWDDKSSTEAYARWSSQTIVGGTVTSSVGVGYPSDLVSGDLFLVFITADDGSAKTISTPTGFTQLYHTAGSGDLRRGACYYRIADGTETGTVTFTASGTCDALLSVCYVIKGNSSSAPEASTPATGSSTSPDAASLTPSWGSATTTWMTVNHNASGSISGVTVPTGFTAVTLFAVGNAVIDAAMKFAEETSLDAGAWTIASSAWIATTVAIEPKVTVIEHDSTNGRLKFPAAANSSVCAEQDVTVGASYQSNVHALAFSIEGTRGGSLHLRIGSTSGAEDILTEVKLGVGEHVIEFTPGTGTIYIRFCNKNTVVQDMYLDDVSIIDNAAVEIAAPYDYTELDGIGVYPSEDDGGIAYLLHESYWPRKLIRRGHRSWSLQEAVFQDGPYLSVNGGTDFTSKQLVGNPLFENGLDGWTDASSGDGFIKHTDTSQLVELDPGTSGGSGNAVLRESVTVNTNAVHVVHILTAGGGPVALKIGVSAGDGEYVDENINAGWHTYKIEPDSAFLHIEFAYAEYGQDNAGVAACLVYPQDVRLLEADGTTGSVTLTAYGFTPFTSADVGRMIRLTHPGNEPGWGVISAYTSSSVVTVQVYRKLASIKPTEDWQFGAWGGDQGHPQVMGFFDGRSVLAHTTAAPKTLWFSQSGDFENMRPDSYVSGGITVEDDDAISNTIRSAGIDPVLWFSGKSSLICGTATGQWVVDSAGAVITPTDISAKRHTEIKSADVSVGVNDITLYADRSRRRVYEVGFQFNNGSYVSTDLTVLAEHILRSKAQELAFQSAPSPMIWCVRADGRLATLLYDREHDVLGWSQSILGGTFSSGDPVVESIASVPGAEDSNQVNNSDERDEVWLVVKRTIDSGTKRYIEFMETAYEGPLREDYSSEAAWRTAVVADQKDAFYVDCGLTYDGAAATTITGLSHLEGETVKVLADGKVVADATVSSGQITLASSASKVQVGLSYKHRYESLKMAFAGEGGTAVTKIKAITSVGMVLLDSGTTDITTVEYDTYGRKLHDLYTISFIRPDDDQTAAVPVFSGEYTHELEGGSSGDARLYCEGTAPLPFTVIGLAPTVVTEAAPSTRN